MVSDCSLVLQRREYQLSVLTEKAEVSRLHVFYAPRSEPVLSALTKHFIHMLSLRISDSLSIKDTYHSASIQTLRLEQTINYLYFSSHLIGSQQREHLQEDTLSTFE